MCPEQNESMDSNCPLSTKEWIIVLSSEINAAKYPDFLPFMSFILVVTIALITFMVNTSLAYNNCIASNLSNSNCKLAGSLMLIFVDWYPAIAILLGVAIVIGFITFLIEYFKIDKRVKDYKYIRKNIIRGETDSDKIREEWKKINMANWNIKKYLTFDVLVTIALLLVVISVFADYFLAGEQKSYSIQTISVSAISAFVTIILVKLTADYAESTKKMLDEQVKTRKIALVEKKLENIYSPMNSALNEYRLKCESLPNDRIPDNYNTELIKLHGVILNVSNKYNHLLTKEMINYYNDELWKVWTQFSHAETVENYRILHSRIIMFNDLSSREMKKEKELLIKMLDPG